MPPPMANLSRREREALQAQQARERYQKLHAEGKTDEARADLARLKLVRERREAEAARKQAEKEDRPPHYDLTHWYNRRDDDGPHAIRFHVPDDGDVTINDQIRGEVTWKKTQASALQIPAGYFCEQKVGEQAIANLAPASDESAAQAEVSAALDSATSLDALELKLRDAPAPWRKR